MKIHTAGIALLGMAALAAPASATSIYRFSNGCTRTCSGTWRGGLSPGTVACLNKDGSPGTAGPLTCLGVATMAFSPNVFDRNGIPLSKRVVKETPRRPN
jgi:hypothetical protein